MITKIGAIWVLACAMAMAKPGDLDRNFDPELRSWVAPNHVTVAAGGRAWVGGGFDRGDGASTGDLLKLGANGGVAQEPAPGYLGKRNGISVGSGLSDAIAPFHLAGGDFLLPAESGGWLRMNAAGTVVGKAFPDRLAGETITPQFERDGKLWVIREYANGERRLEKRESASGLIDAGFLLAATDVNGAVPGADGTVWILAGEVLQFWYDEIPSRRIFQADPAGNPVGVPLAINALRTVELAAGPVGAFRVVYGPDQTFWGFWPMASSGSYRIEWYSAAGIFERRKDFSLSLNDTFVWAEGADGSLVAADGAVRVPGQSQWYIGKDANLRHYGADGILDESFQTPGEVRSVVALADGKWLVDGLRRLNANGSEDETWTAPQLDRPARVTTLSPLPGGRLLAVGDFATADGLVRNRLVVFRADGTVEPSFIADERIGEWISVAVSGEEIYVVTAEPVRYGNEVVSNLVKLSMDGVLDENYEPLVPLSTYTGGARFQPVDNVTKVHAVGPGDILVETWSSGGDVPFQTLSRLKSDGSRDAGMQVLRASYFPDGIVVRENGGFVIGATIYRRNGSVENDLIRENIGLRPLCEWLGGVVFLETGNGPTGRLRWWLGNGWCSWFRPPVIANVGDGVLAAPGENGSLYVNAAFKGGTARLLRLHGFGWVDRSFRAPDFTSRERQPLGGWWKAEESGKVTFKPVRHETISSPVVMLWHPASRRLWTGGNFNTAGGRPRDGLARVHGGVSRWPWW
ncbi:MAG: delta-60 repeat domain-containing protein [Luteolibacter sp.]|uniref:delta-60 repeat domain-containing protein n=1 Tax=Luteolibacter sp. TaxID=1962973 RepID=UPI00326322AD